MKRLILFLGILLTIAITIQAESVNFTGTGPSAVANLSQFRIVYSINADAKDFRAGEINNFDVLMGPSTSRSQSIQIMNGSTQSSTTTSYTYILQAKKEGTYTIPAATIIVGNQKYTSNAITVRVLPADKQVPQQQGGNQHSSSAPSQELTNVGGVDVFIRAVPSKTVAYQQECILLTYKLYVRGANVAGFSNMKFPETKGFLSQEVQLSNDKQFTLENYNGKNYNTIILKQTLLYPQQSGKLRIGQGTFDAILRIQNQSHNRGGFFSDFFNTYQDVKKTITSPAIEITTKDLPFGKPKSYANAVGNFNIKSSITTTKLKVNDAITIKLNISGNGNFKLIQNPEIKFPADFELYDPKVSTNLKNTATGVSGTKTIEYLAIARHPGHFTIPAIEFGYFDTKTNSYKTLQTESYDLTVEKGNGGESQGIMTNFTDKEGLKLLGHDIRYINTTDSTLKPKGTFFFGSIAFWFSYLIPLLLAIIVFIVYRKQAKENANIALVRTKKANKVATKRLKIAQKYLQHGEKEKFYDEVLKALWGYFSDKLSIPVANLTKDQIEIELSKTGIEEELINDFKDILSTCEYARYSPAGGTDMMDQLYNKTIEKISLLEEKIKK
jgi:hypothetical protein